MRQMPRNFEMSAVRVSRCPNHCHGGWWTNVRQGIRGAAVYTQLYRRVHKVQCRRNFKDNVPSEVRARVAMASLTATARAGWGEEEGGVEGSRIFFSSERNERGSHAGRPTTLTSPFLSSFPSSLLNSCLVFLFASPPFHSPPLPSSTFIIQHRRN